MDFAARLAAVKAAHLYRTPYLMESAQGREVVMDGRRVLLFCSNSYLGLNNRPEILRAAIRAVDAYGVGAGGSRLVSGNMRPHVRLENLLARFKGSEAALLCNSGYTANVGVISALCGAESHIFSDALNHASIIDGCRLARARTVVYAHNDPADLEAKIVRERPRQGLIVTDAVFSMDGDVARLPELARISRRYGLPLMVDDAHATGVLGATGRGSLEHFGLSHQDVAIVMTTLSKAVPSEGGVICGSRDMCDLVRNTARPFIFTTALSPATAAAAHAGVAYIMAHPELVRRLRENTARLARNLTVLGLPASDATPIFPIIVGDEEKARRAGEELLRRGVFIPCIRYPTVARGAARLRLTVMAGHTDADLDYAAACIAKALRLGR
ncbi:8-amino-7-oxononanoate synthase [Desulfovibrio legallii]|uniref:8-amino-7-oxononanoate synthase n=1 Tax=Desulfovibrio legallii TaxID=571438 RepID=A0A6H3FE01_9BACT|nr:8-amino-7-oxononanoate synthase [Desulfovibrio legallii]TBH81489.1 8-amino-7-oxononanoate synthase [Desulfovibrio legallii]